MTFANEKDFVTSAHLQIERVIRRSRIGNRAEADFLLGQWQCCWAWIVDGVPHIQARGADMTPAQAFAVTVAIQLAIEWLSEELA